MALVDIKSIGKQNQLNKSYSVQISGSKNENKSLTVVSRGVGWWGGKGEES